MKASLEVTSAGTKTQGRLIILTGPSGVGKGTLVNQLLKQHPTLFLSVSATTRLPRPNELEGTHYYFLSRTAFADLIARGELLEWAEYLNNFYGTLRQPVLDKLVTGVDVLLEIEVQGASQVLVNFPDAVSIFLLPPSLETLAQRLQQRHTENPETIQRRLARARLEVTESAQFRYQVVNDQLQDCLEQLESILYPKKADHGEPRPAD